MLDPAACLASGPARTACVGIALSAVAGFPGDRALLRKNRL